jgi:acyl carrier protein
MKLDKKNIKKILININPKINSFINKKNINLTDNGLLDSLMIIKFISEIENLTKKKIKISKINRNSFANIESILEFLKK